jgi:TolA-binding protein
VVENQAVAEPVVAEPPVRLTETVRSETMPPAVAISAEEQAIFRKTKAIPDEEPFARLPMPRTDPPPPAPGSSGRLPVAGAETTDGTGREYADAPAGTIIASPVVHTSAIEQMTVAESQTELLNVDSSISGQNELAAIYHHHQDPKEQLLAELYERRKASVPLSMRSDTDPASTPRREVRKEKISPKSRKWLLIVLLTFIVIGVIGAVVQFHFERKRSADTGQAKFQEQSQLQPQTLDPAQFQNLNQNEVQDPETDRQLAQEQTQSPEAGRSGPSDITTSLNTPEPDSRKPAPKRQVAPKPEKPGQVTKQPAPPAAETRPVVEYRPETAPPPSNNAQVEIRRVEPRPASQPKTAQPELSANDHLKNGLALLNARLYQDAIREFEGVRRLAPANKDIHYLLGQAYHQMGKLDQALAAYRQCTSGVYATVSQNHVKTLEKKLGK